jgi:hypothetical protein
LWNVEVGFAVLDAAAAVPEATLGNPVSHKTWLTVTVTAQVRLRAEVVYAVAFIG